MSLGENVRKSREREGMTQGELAKKIGKSVSLISMIENDERSGSITTIREIAKTLNVSVDSLFAE